MTDLVVALSLDIKPIDDINILDGQSKICNWLYNRLLEKANDLKDEYKNTQDDKTALTLYSKRGLRNLIPDLKKELPFLKSVYSSPLKNVALRLSDAISSYQKSRKGRRQGSPTGWPKFRSWKLNWFSLFYDEPNKGYKIQEKKLLLSLGVDQDGTRLKFAFHLKDAHLLNEKEIRSLRIVKQGSVYKAIFSVYRKLPQSKPIKKIIAFDPNHKNLCYGTDLEGNAIEIAKASWLKAYDKRLDELKSRRDKCKKQSKSLKRDNEKKVWIPSRRYTKFNIAIDKLLHKRREQTKTFLRTIANQLFKKYDCVSVGDYIPTPDLSIGKKMRRSMCNQSLIGRFKKELSWYAIRSGKMFLEFDEYRTTKTCYKCDHIVIEGLHPSIREWTCPGCCKKHIRDENSAQNGIRRTIKTLDEKNILVPCSGPVEVTKRWAWRVSPQGVRKRMLWEETALDCNCQEIKTGM